MDFVSARSWFANEAERVYLASTRLDGKAAKAWATKRSQLGAAVDEGGTSQLNQFTLDDFYVWLVRRFEDVNAQDKRRQQYDTCCQGSRSVSAYAMQLESIAERLTPRIPDWELLAKFKSGLTADILIEMARVRPPPETFEEYRNTADGIDRSIRAAGQVALGRSVGPRPLSTPSAWSSQPNASRSNGPVPMDLGAVNMTTKADAKWSERRKARLCYGCGAGDHYIKQCPANVQNRRESGNGRGRN